MESQVITIMNMKGGVGKTTVAMHLGGIISRVGLNDQKAKKVLIIDYDPQFNLSQAFLPAEAYYSLEEKRKTAMAILVDDDSDLNPFHLQVAGNHMPPNVEDIATRIYNYGGGVLDIVASTLDLMYVAVGQPGVHTKAMEERFGKFIDQCRSLYDIILIDCHPAGSLFTKTALHNSDHVVIPVAPQRFAARGISLMMEFTRAKNFGRRGPVPHILFNLAPRSEVSPLEQEIRANPRYSKYCLEKTLKRYSVFGDPVGGKGFVWHSGKAYSTEAFFNLKSVAAELLKRIGV
jgi:chromosome partitioning protein